MRESAFTSSVSKSPNRLPPSAFEANAGTTTPAALPAWPARSNASMNRSHASSAGGTRSSGWSLMAVHYRAMQPGQPIPVPSSIGLDPVTAPVRRARWIDDHTLFAPRRRRPELDSHVLKRSDAAATCTGTNVVATDSFASPRHQYQNVNGGTSSLGFFAPPSRSPRSRRRRRNHDPLNSDAGT